MKKILVMFVVIFLTTMCLFLQTDAKSKTNSFVNENIIKFEKQVDFKILKLQNNEDWRLEIKPLVVGNTEIIRSLRLSYFEKNSDHLIVSIEQMKDTGFLKLPVTKDASIYYINGNKAYFDSWKDSINSKAPVGGILQWAQNGTYIQMMSDALTKDDMVKLAKSLY